MEYTLCSVDCALPCEVTIDDDNGRYMIRKSDTSGEVFNTAEELIAWVKSNWKPEEFCDPNEFNNLLKQLNIYSNNSFILDM
jgi:hypothetical protein